MRCSLCFKRLYSLANAFYLKGEAIMSSKFYIEKTFGEKGVEWPATNYTDEEIKIIYRFLNDLNKYFDGYSVDCICVFDDEGE